MRWFNGGRHRAGMVSRVGASWPLDPDSASDRSTPPHQLNVRNLLQ